MTGSEGNKDVHGTNSKRLAEVWMDDYKRLFYVHRMGLKVCAGITQVYCRREYYRIWMLVI
jgi:hypothetical protein